MNACTYSYMYAKSLLYMYNNDFAYLATDAVVLFISGRI